MSSQAGGTPENEENQSDVTAAVPTGAQVSGINSGFKYLTSLRGHQNEIVVAKFSPCGTFLATGGEDKLVRIWCLTDGTMHKELYGNNSGVNDIAWHEDINKLATGGDDHSVKIWDLQLDDANHSNVFLKHSHSLKKHRGLVLCVSFKSCYIGNSYEHLLASGSHDNTVCIWDAEEKTLRNKLVGHEMPVTAVDFNNNGSLLLSSSYDGSVRLWDTHDGSHLFTLVSKSTPVTFSRFIKEDDWYVHMAMLDGTIELWSFEQLDRKLITTYKGHKNALFPVHSGTCFGKYMISGSEDGYIYIWPISGTSPEKLTLPGGPIVALDIHPHKAMIATSQLSRVNDKNSKNPSYRKIDIWLNEEL